MTAHRESQPGVRLGEVSGLMTTLPDDPMRNTALRAAQAVLQAVKAPFGARLDVKKGVPISAGMGGSAASAVAAAAAVNALLDKPFSTAELLPFALEGERASADPPPWDNVMASLLGGLVIAAQLDPAIVKPMPVPQGISAVLFHPDAKTETQAARDVLQPEVPLNTAVEHARRLGAFTLGCATSDLELIRAGLDDVLIEPQRAFLLPEMRAVKAAALNAGALGCSFSGSGPSIFAWAADLDLDAVEAAMLTPLSKPVARPVAIGRRSTASECAWSRPRSKKHAPDLDPSRRQRQLHLRSHPRGSGRRWRPVHSR